MRLIRCFSFGKVSNSRVINRLKLAVAEMLRPFCCHASERSAFYIPKTCVILAGKHMYGQKEYNHEQDPTAWNFLQAF